MNGNRWIRSTAALAFGLALVLASASPAGLGRAASQAHAQTTAPAFSAQGWLVSTTQLDAQTRRLTCVGARGRFEIDVNAQTEVRGPGGERLSASELEAGLHIEAEGSLRADARVEAASILAAPPLPSTEGAEVQARGRIRAVLEAAPSTGGRDIVILSSASGETVIEVRAGTQIVDAEGRAVGLAALEIGQALEIRGRGSLEAALRAERIALLPAGRQSRLGAEGRLLARAGRPEGEAWVVGEVSLAVPAAMALESQATVGQTVSITAEPNAEGGLSVLGLEILLRSDETLHLRGTVEARSQDRLTLDGMQIEVDAGTAIEGEVEVGSFVEVDARMGEAGGLEAISVRALLSAEVEVQFEGTIEALGLGGWTVGGVETRIDLLGTVIVGLAPLVGLHAEVTGLLQEDGSVKATRIHVQADLRGGLSTFEGRLSEVGTIPGTWGLVVELAGGATASYALEVDAETLIDESRGVAAVGARAQVSAEVIAEGRLDAAVIRIR